MRQSRKLYTDHCVLYVPTGVFVGHDPHLVLNVQPHYDYGEYDGRRCYLINAHSMREDLL